MFAFFLKSCTTKHRFSSTAVFFVRPVFVHHFSFQIVYCLLPTPNIKASINLTAFTLFIVHASNPFGFRFYARLSLPLFSSSIRRKVTARLPKNIQDLPLL